MFIGTHLCSSISCSISPTFCANDWSVVLKFVYCDCSSEPVSEIEQTMSLSQIRDYLAVCEVLYLDLTPFCRDLD